MAFRAQWSSESVKGKSVGGTSSGYPGSSGSSGSSGVVGGRVGGFRLSLVGATAWVRGMESLKPWQRYAVYIAGPVTNALIAGGAWVAARFLCGNGEFMQVVHCGHGELLQGVYYGNGGFLQTVHLCGLGRFSQAVFLYNVVLCVFNLLPVFPLDGGRLVQLVLGNRIGVLRANRLLLKIGLAAGYVLIGLGLVQAVLYPWNITLVCAGVYIRRKNKQLPPQLYWECIRALQAKDKRLLPTKKISLPKNTTVMQAVEYLGWDYYAEIHIGSGWVSEDELLMLLLSQPLNLSGT